MIAKTFQNLENRTEKMQEVINMNKQLPRT